MEHHITIRSGEQELAATLHYPESGNGENKIRKGNERFPIIIIAHGFVGSRIGVDRLFVLAAREYARNGYMVLRYDYGGCGESTGDYGSGGLDVMIDQTRSVLDYALDIDCVDPQRVILLGHSLGGAVSILTAARDKRVKTLVLWSAVAYPFNDIVGITGKKAYEEAVQLGSTDYLGYSLKPVFFESLAKHQPFEQLRKFSGDVFLVHGTADDVIPVDYCFLYQKLFWLRSQGQCDKEVIFQADHTFTGGQAKEQVIRKTRDWLLHIDKRKNEWNDWTI
ncbi:MULTISPECIES: alpha/beta fold hydrolase [unclassified Paenibacillus]|uniref:alpha/beta hydrolase family protein n=1 Tax=unclassified Paenibacillus TaxID=185978 RepID=UPI001AE5A14D|nr:MULTISPECIES: alpha/beta fold hydrolase [unclassified Paenibacillus]MBP1155626.1 pimeloyl-ACP methyl ester carboxylesterase [Paenibacillus sp. PvP091]MBP1168988.1 pimeloyl-ACP methyl ester carboxylesterase [Paenibacillus sp. PvR098]MBP2440016.1 pimeloyl-ACP methyl ester carboxylesterase [Paenibacillus sp. PvP052]